MFTLKSGLGLGLIVAISSQSAWATELFSASIVVNGQTQEVQNVAYSNIQDLVKQYNESNLRQLLGYQRGDAFSSTISLRGWQNAATISSVKDSSSIILKVPSLGIELTFDGQDRSAARKNMQEFFEGNEGQSTLKQITRQAVKESSADPIIGNPSSLAQMMTNASASMAASVTNNLDSTVTSSTQSVQNTIDQTGTVAKNAQSISKPASDLSVLPRLGRYTQNGIQADVFTVPLSYMQRSQDMGIFIDAPVTVVKIQDTVSWSGSLGLGLQFMVQPDWYLMPIARVGIAASNDLGASAAIYSAGLSSNYIFYPTKSSSLSVMNMVSYYKTGEIDLGSYKGSYDLNNIVYRNGIEYRQKTSYTAFNKPIITKIQLARTDYTGDEVYSSYSHDISMSFGVKNTKKDSILSEYRVGGTYTFGDGDVDGFSINFGYTF